MYDVSNIYLHARSAFTGEKMRKKGNFTSTLAQIHRGANWN